MLDGSDEPWGVLALITIMVLTVRAARKEPAQTHKANLTFSALVLLIYAISYPFAPPLVRAALAMTTMALTLSTLYFKRSCHPGLWGLAMLSLPLIASLQFYLGYPLRVLVGSIAVPMLRMAGHQVMRQGTGLVFGEHSILIDATCSGIKMLWVGGYLVCVLSCYWRLSAARTLMAGVIGIAVIILGNAVRTAALFYMETGLFQPPQYSHQAVGLAAFAMTSIAILLFMQRMATMKGRLA
jgi:exosortase/archaeosortase family protein